MNKSEEYIKLLSRSYEEVVELLLQKYGKAKEDYYREKSYKRFLNGEIKSITKGKHTRTSEGLYCHHIDENKILNLTDISFIKNGKIPFKYQKKERLVYCDLFEHAILHILIANESKSVDKKNHILNKTLGLSGYLAYIGPNIEEWYLLKKVPIKQWELNCYEKAYLSPEKAFSIIKSMNKLIDCDHPDTLQKYYEKRRAKEKEIQIIRKRILQRKKEARLKMIENAKKLTVNSPRQEIITSLHSLKYQDELDFKEFNRTMKVHFKETLLKEIQDYIKNQ